MITRDIDAFIAVACTLKPDFGAATARAAFLVCGDLDLAARLIQSEPLTVGATEPKEKIKDLVQWSVSEAYFTLREQLGISVVQGA